MRSWDAFGIMLVSFLVIALIIGVLSLIYVLMITVGMCKFFPNHDVPVSTAFIPVYRWKVLGNIIGLPDIVSYLYAGGYTFGVLVIALFDFKLLDHLASAILPLAGCCGIAISIKLCLFRNRSHFLWLAASVFFPGLIIIINLLSRDYDQVCY